MTHEPETTLYQNSLRTWEIFHARSTELDLGKRLRDLEAPTFGQIEEALWVIPSAERTPVAFGVFLQAAAGWSAIEQTHFLSVFLAASSKPVRRILEAAVRGALKTPDHLPVTLEEFPSRIWKRAVDSGSPTRLVTAGHQAVRAMIRLSAEYENLTEATSQPPDLRHLKPGDSMEFTVPSGDLPVVCDLLALPPSTLPEMKTRVLDRIMENTMDGRFELTEGQDWVFSAWAFADTCESSDHISVVLRQVATTLKKLGDRKNLHSSHHAQRLGRFLFRLGLRGDSMRCAKAVGISPWEHGWQFQSLRASTHNRIRDLLIRPETNTDAWSIEPALACSAMSIPLWLANPINRVEALQKLFQMSADCPWLFPRLQHVFQWHLALVGKQKALHEIEVIAPDWSVGLGCKVRTQ